MDPEQNTLTSRRQFLKAAGGAAAVSALGGASVPAVHAQGSDVVQVALVGSGGRGSGAAVDALATQQKKGPVKLVAMADAYQDRLDRSHAGLSREHPTQVDVPSDRRFVGFEAYQKAMDCLKPGDVAIFATPCAFRWVHFQYAIQKRLNVFMEKPVTADGPSSRRMLKLAEDASKANLKCGVGLMSRHYRGLQELHDRIQNGELGDIVLMRGYRMQGAIGHCLTTPQDKKPGWTDLDLQVRRFHSFLWSGGGAYSDYNIHIVDHLCWMKNTWPVKAQGVGGRHYKVNREGQPYIDQNFDSYSVEYTFPDGSKMFFDGRTIEGCAQIYNSYIHGSKGSAIASRSGDFSGPAAIFKGQSPDPEKQVWVAKDLSNPYRNEWDDLMDAIRNDKPYNEVKRGVEASVATSMGRMAAHTGQEITFEEMLNHEHEYAPNADRITSSTSPAPLTPDAEGFYPAPQPGRKGKREY